MAYPAPAEDRGRLDVQLAVLLLPQPLEEFALREQAQDLLRAEGVIAVDPARLGYAALARMPELAGEALAARQGKRLVRALRRRGRPRVVVMFHPLQYQLARAVMATAGEPVELWYGRAERHEAAPGAPPALRERLERLHEQAAQRSSLTFVATEQLAEIEREHFRRAIVVPRSADRFPAPDPGGEAVVAVALGLCAERVDWALVDQVAELLGDRLVLLVAGEPAAGAPERPSIVWLGQRPDEELARIALAADVGLAPLRRDAFEDATLPPGVLELARLGRRTIVPELAGARTWEPATVLAPDAVAVADALAAHAGARLRPDAELRAWALAQTARVQDEPLWERLRLAGVDVRVGAG